MPDGWTDPFYFPVRQVTPAVTATIELVVPKGWILEISAVEVTNESAVRGHCHGVITDNARVGGVAIFNGDLVDIGLGTNATFMWQGRVTARESFFVYFFDVVIGDILNVLAQCRMRRI